MAVSACTPIDYTNTTAKTDTPVATGQRLTRPQTPSGRPCQQIVWRDDNANRYHYQFDTSQRLSQCTAFERTSSLGSYTLTQQLLYTRQGLLQRVSDGEDSSRYHYHDGRLVSIDFFQAKQPVYRYLVTMNQEGMIVGLRGMPLNDSGLLACTTHYQLDEQGRYVQLDLKDSRGMLYYRIKQGDFQPADGHLYGSLVGVPYDLNRYPWINWSQAFPVSPHLAGRVAIFQYAAPETPTDLIKRADVSIRWQRNRQGHITGQFSTDLLTTIRDTTRFVYLNCP